MARNSHVRWKSRHAARGTQLWHLAAVISAFVLLGLISQPTSAAELIGRASVIDGDTIEIHGQRIRLWGIDAPESRQPCYINGKSWPCGRRAAFALSDELGQRTVACKERGHDRYHRVVAICSVAGVDIAAWLVSNGWALDWPRYSHRAYAADQDEAASGKRGMWQGSFDKPWKWRHRGGNGG